MSTDDECQQAHTPLHALGTAGGPGAGAEVVVRGRLARVRQQGNSCFLVLRAGIYHTAQAVFFRDKETPAQSKAMLRWLGALTTESIVEVSGQLRAADVRGCSQDSVEISMQHVRLVSAAAPALPFELDDANRSAEEIAAAASSERPIPLISQEQRLNHRWIDLRTPSSQAVMRVQAAVCALFRESLGAQGFVEIHTPKLVPGASEGGADAFRTDYFGQVATLAQSPQLYKQMAIAADMERVFEIGPVFRAEKSHTRRHLCEYTGLDMEMAFFNHYNEVVRVLHRTLVDIFRGVEGRCAAELAAVRGQFPSAPPRTTEEPLIVHWEEAMGMLRDAGEEVDELGDMTTAMERRLGALVAERHGADLYFLDRFPATVRPFYTMRCPDDPRLSNSCGAAPPEPARRRPLPPRGERPPPLPQVRRLPPRRGDLLGRAARARRADAERRH